MTELILLFPENPTIWIFIVAVVFLLFGGSKLPQLAKALGQSKKAFKEGLAEAEEEDQAQKARQLNATEAKAAPLSAVDDEALFEEARRRARLRTEGSRPQGENLLSEKAAADRSK